MKKSLLSIFASAIIMGSSIEVVAQMNGNLYSAPNFDLYDINGNRHRLYEDYLDNNIPVIVDVFAHWCGPCWSYHGTHALKDFYNAYGPGKGGPCEVMVIAGDGDANSTFAELYGGSGSQGDWVTGIPYPIFGGDSGIGAGDGRALATALQIAYFPTIYMIHPDRTIEEIGPMSFSELQNTACNYKPLSTNTDDAAMHYITSIPSLCIGEEVVFDVLLKNYSTQPMTSAEFEVTYDGTVIDTFSWTGSLEPYQLITASASIPDIQEGNHTIIAKILKVNGINDANTSNNTYSTTFSIKSSDQKDYELSVRTDSYGEETDWEILDENDDIIFTKSDFRSADYGNNATYKHTVELIDAGCYKVVLKDAFGDGISNGYLKVKDDKGKTVLTLNGDFTDETSGKWQSFYVDPFASVEEVKNASLSVYPNPVKDVASLEINLKSATTVSIKIYNVLGEIVYNSLSNMGGSQSINIDMKNLPSGVYTLNVVAGEEQFTEKIIK